MNKVLLSLYVVLFLLLSCSKEGESINDMVDKNKIEVTVNLTEEKKIQVEVDSGHQPWRLEPIDVAYSVLVDIDNKVDFKNCHLIEEGKTDAKVECINDKNYHVSLKRLVRSDGIWTAVLIEILRK